MELQSAAFSIPAGDPGITELEGDWVKRQKRAGVRGDLKQSWQVRGEGGKACGEVGGCEADTQWLCRDNLQLSSGGNVTLTLSFHAPCCQNEYSNVETGTFSM